MRATNYNNQVASFTPLEPHQNVRVALVEGLKPKYKEVERQRYRRVLKDNTNVDESRIDALFRIFGHGPRSEREKTFLDALVADVAYDSGNWRAFQSSDYDTLEREGVVVRYSGDNQGLVQKVLETDENKVIFAKNPEWEQSGLDYVKHINWKNKLVINGPDGIIQFAEDKGFELPESFLKYRRPTEAVYQLLEQYGFTYTQALKTAIRVLKSPKYSGRDISVLVIKNPNGNELRLHHHDFVEAAELLTYALEHKKPVKLVKQILGDLLEGGDKYHGLNEFSVLKRRPRRGRPDNHVETHYLPNLEYPERNVLEWMNTVTSCNCENGLNLRNFEERRGRKTYVVQTFETHSGVVVLDIQRSKDINSKRNPNNLNPLATPEFSRFVDKLRYNVVQETEVLSGEKTRIRRTPTTEVGIEISINELAKLWKFEDMYGPAGRMKEFILRPMY
tara:strand:- start:623 stop:1966 length:1344 start_codon:yes stop_codon:yes gene_type:complete